MSKPGLTFGEIGSLLAGGYEKRCNPVEPGCPFFNGLAEFLGRNNDAYAKRFCSFGCSPLCHFEMIEKNRKLYNQKLRELQ